MRPWIKFGLIVGAVGLLVNIVVSFVVGFCGPLTGLVAGAVAGFWAATVGRAPTKGTGARMGALSGLIAGALTLVGQVIGGLLALAFIQSGSVPPLFGTVPERSADATTQLLYYASGAAVAFCFGMVGVAAAMAAGVGAAYLGTTETPPASGADQTDDL